jgi:hypothetical protein
MHDLQQIYWGNPSSANSKDNANDPQPCSRLVVMLHLFELPLPPVLSSTLPPLDA